MKVCGVEIKGSEAIICLLSESDGLISILDCRVRQLNIGKNNTAAELKAFAGAFRQLMKDYKIDAVAIRERPTKGKFAGGAMGFKLEAAIQLCEEVAVDLLTPSQIKAILADNPLRIPFESTDLKAFQEPAFITGYTYLMSVGKS